MAIYSCGYPVHHTFPVTDLEPIDYTILIGSEEIYSGRVYPTVLENLVIDISDVLEQYLEVYYESLPSVYPLLTNVPSADNRSSIHTFTVRDSISEVDQNYTVMYNYNTDYISLYPDSGSLNEPLSLELDPRQKVNVSGYNISGTSTFSYRINNGSPISSVISSQVFQNYQIDLEPFSLVPGDSFTMSYGSKDYVFEIIRPCNNRFVLHYVNKLGGLDNLLCSGRSTQTYSSKSSDVVLHNDRLGRLDFEQTRLKNRIQKKYKLVTGWMKDDADMDSLVFSPKIWIENLEKKTITSCLISNTEITIKNHRTDGFVTYELSVTESQKYKR